MDKKFLLVTLFFILTFVAFTGYVVFRDPILRLTRASEEKSVSLSNSLVFAWPLKLKADGTSKSEITVFVRSPDGKGLGEQSVSLISSLGVVQEPRLISNIEGKAIFHLTSDLQGVANIEVLVNNKKLVRSVTIEFE